MVKAPPVVWPRRAAWVGYAACCCGLVYAAMKVYEAVEGRLGLPGFPAPANAYNQYHNVMLDQLGNAGMGIVAALVALASVQPWGRIIPRWLLLPILVIGFALLAAGASGFLLRALHFTGVFGPRPVGWTGFLVVGFLMVWAILWGATTWHYWRKSRRESIRHG